MKVSFTVYAKPEPQGSTKAFMRKGARFPIVTSDNKNLKSYRQQVAIVALGAMKDLGLEPLGRKVPVSMALYFYVARPASKSKKAYPTVKPDLDKLVRAIGDALTGICFEDDSQVVHCEARKYYGSPEKTTVEVYADT